MKFKIKYIAKEFKTSLNEGHFQNSFKQSIQSLFVNLCKWFLKIVWSIKWLLFACLLIIVFALYIHLKLQLTSDIGICYLLSAISQGLAAILAIILSATLVAGQLAARYSPQLLKNAFKSSTIVYILIFVVGIVFPLVILANRDMMASSILVKISLIWASACLILLIPYFLSLKEWLDPKNLIVDLYWKAFKTLRNKKDKLPEEASTIGEVAISLYSAKNYEGYGNGLKKLTQLVKDISLSSEKVVERKEDVEEERQEELVVEIPQVVRQLIDMLRHIGILVEDDPVATGKVIEALGECAIVVQDLDVNKEIIDGLEEAVYGAIECGREVPCKQIAFLLGGIGGKAAAKAQPTTARRILQVLRRMFSLSLDNSWDKAARQVIIAIHSVGKIGIDRVDEAKELEGVIRVAITRLRQSYGEAVGKEWFGPAGEAAWRLRDLGWKAMEKGCLEAPTKAAISSMGRITEKAIEFNKEGLTREAIEALVGYGHEAVGKCPEEVAIICLEELTTIGSAVLDVYEDLARKVIEGIGRIGGERGINQSKPEVVEEAINSLNSLGEKIKGTKPHIASLIAAQLWKFGGYAMECLPEKQASIKMGLDNLEKQVGKKALENGFKEVIMQLPSPPSLLSEFRYYYETI